MDDLKEDNFFFTYDGVSIVDIFNTHLNIFNAKVHFQVIQFEISVSISGNGISLDVNFGSDTI